MTNAHDRFEALAGALALGEATADERTCFEAHARDCALCGDDPSEAALLRTLVETTREAESWRPSLRDTIFARIHERRLGRSRFTIGALGWAFAISVVLNAAVVSGAASSLGRALRDREPVSDVVATQIRLETTRPAQHAGMALVRVAVASRYAAPLPRRPARASVPPANSQPSRKAETNVDDILAGLDLAMSRGLAMAPLARCESAATSPVLPAEPCANPQPSDVP